jgi:hypothetical protein
VNTSSRTPLRGSRNTRRRCFIAFPIHASTASGAFRGAATASAVPQQKRSDVEGLRAKTGGNWLIPHAAPCNSARSLETAQAKWRLAYGRRPRSPPGTGM